MSIAAATGMDLAVRAGQDALSSLAMTTTGPLPAPDLHFHAAIWRGSRGIDFWSRASYVRSRLGLPAGPGITTEINAMSNSLIGSIDLSARILAGSPDTNTVMLTGGETFGAPAFDHLAADHGIAYGDGGSALILGRKPGIAQVLATSSWTDPTLEELHRGQARFLPPGTTEVGVETIRQRKAQYLDAVGPESIRRRNAAGISHVMNNALTHADLDLQELAWILLPHYGHQLLHTHCLQPLGIKHTRTLIHAGDQWGHLGPNDQLVGLTHLITQHAVKPGDYLALVGIGIGMTWTANIIRIDTVPQPCAPRPCRCFGRGAPAITHPDPSEEIHDAPNNPRSARYSRSCPRSMHPPARRHRHPTHQTAVHRRRPSRPSPTNDGPPPTATSTPQRIETRLVGDPRTSRRYYARTHSTTHGSMYLTRRPTQTRQDPREYHAVTENPTPVISISPGSCRRCNRMAVRMQFVAPRSPQGKQNEQLLPGYRTP